MNNYKGQPERIKKKGFTRWEQLKLKSFSALQLSQRLHGSGKAPDVILQKVREQGHVI